MHVAAAHCLGGNVLVVVGQRVAVAAAVGVEGAAVAVDYEFRGGAGLLVGFSY